MSLERLSCPSCGASDFRHDDEGNLICGFCGTKFDSPREVVDCPVCGTENPPQAVKCMGCGHTLGRMCPACNYANPPAVDHCLQCATPLDTLSSVFMRTGEGRHRSAALIKEELVKTKAQDMAYMQQQRAQLDAEEAARLAGLRSQRIEAQRQQQIMVIIAVLGLMALIGCVAAYIAMAR